MSKFKKTLALFLAGLPYASSNANIQKFPDSSHSPKSGDPGPVDLRPLNSSATNIFAAHRSHSSHSSHRSSSGGGYSPPPAPPPARSEPVDRGRQSVVSPTPARPANPVLSREEKLKLQVMRVQISLTGLGIYSGPVDGVLGEGTKSALKLFQKLKGSPRMDS
ncbi:MAG: peptidoglycan-binding protein [Proteobacteria bacterium]|nr:peptidoglycan-binding protein [Pseudomonadota bacterium]